MGNWISFEHEQGGSFEAWQFLGIEPRDRDAE